MVKDEEKFLRAKDISEILSCSLKQAYNIINQPDFPKLTIGKCKFVPRKEFDNWVKMYLRKEYKL